MKYDVAILGGGPGGYESAIRCAKYGLRTALIEKANLGGTCLNRGCIPTKALLHSAELFSIAHSPTEGRNAVATESEFAAMAKRKDRIVQRLCNGISFLERAYGVDVIQGFGVLAGPHEIGINQEIIEADQIILATGSVPALPSIQGVENDRVVTSDEILALTQLPQSMILVGGGVIGLEFASLFSDLGVPVTIIEMLPELLPDIDREIVTVVERHLKRNGVNIFTGAAVERMEDSADAVSVLYTDASGGEHVASAQLCAICAGRKPATRNIGLEQVGVICDAKGFVCVDSQMRTNFPHIYAVGDITGKLQLAHMATAQGMVAAAGCAGLEKSMEYGAVPSCIYTDPEIATIGKSAKALADSGTEFKTGEFRAAGNGRAMTLEATDGMVKIFTSKADGRILGAQIAAPHASDMISEIGAVMHFGGTACDLAEVIHPHPSLSEMIAEAACDVDGLSCNSVPKNKGEM